MKAGGHGSPRGFHVITIYLIGFPEEKTSK